MSDFSCYVVEKDSQDQIKSGMGRRSLSDLPEGEVLIRVAYSSLNYKDALAATGRPGVAGSFRTFRESTRRARSPNRRPPSFKKDKRSW